MTANRDTADWGQFQPQRKNLLINGAMNVWQRGVAFGAVGDIEYTADRWFAGHAVGTTAVTAFSISTNVPISDTIGNSLKVDVTTADASVAASDFYYMAQRIEGGDILATGFGQAGAKALSLSFWAFSSKTGIHTGAIINAARDMSYTFEYTINNTFTWQKINIENIPGETTGTWAFDSSQGMEIRFAFMVGSTFGKTAGSWGTGDVIGTVNQVNIMDNVSGDFRITEVQLEVGEEATDFEHRPFAEELTLCYRYTEVVTLSGVADFLLTAQAFSASQAFGTLQYSEKRAVPTITNTGSFLTTTSGAATNAGTPTWSPQNTKHSRLDITGGSGMAAGDATCVLSGTAPTTIIIDAEL